MSLYLSTFLGFCLLAEAIESLNNYSSKLSSPPRSSVNSYDRPVLSTANYFNQFTVLYCLSTISLQPDSTTSTNWNRLLYIILLLVTSKQASLEMVVCPYPVRLLLCICIVRSGGASRDAAYVRMPVHDAETSHPIFMYIEHTYISPIQSEPFVCVNPSSPYAVHTVHPSTLQALASVSWPKYFQHRPILMTSTSRLHKITNAEYCSEAAGSVLE